ncbi:zinc finger, CCHC-type, retrotransposon gag domain protein [Tanacetum coccineum]
MAPRRRSVNNKADHAFATAVEQAVAALLPSLTAQITNEIRQGKNNKNNGNQRNSRRGKPESSSNDASTPVEAENWIAYIKKIFEVLGCDDQFKARLATYKLEGDAQIFSILEERKVWGQQYGQTFESSSQSGYSDYASSPPCNLYGKFHPGKTCHKATRACFTCGQVGHLAKDCKKGGRSNETTSNLLQMVAYLHSLLIRQIKPQVPF